ncbi:MAG: SH3 domain-containing protein [Chloroflexi bacterium]|nr:SH3 domain-containing protein [Chloroflexota bacterium]
MKRLTTTLLVCALAALAMLALLIPATVAQDGPAPTPTDFFAAIELTLRPTVQAYVGVPQYPLAVLADGTAIPSLTGVGGKAEFSPVAIRSGPGLEFPRIGRVAQGAWIHIVGWNGWDPDRFCTVDFQSDLDMWVQVQTHLTEQVGWVARCALSVVGNVTALPVVNAAGERTLQR